MQQPNAGSTRASSNCASCNWLLHPAPTSARDGLGPLQIALVEFFLSPSPKSNKSVTCIQGSHHLQLALVVFFVCQLSHLLVCTSTYGRALQLTLCDGVCGLWW